MLDFLELSQHNPKKFDIALTWPLPRNVSLAHMCANDIFLDRAKSKDITPLMLVSCNNRDVVVIGDYWNATEIDKLETVAKSVVVYNHDEEQCNLESIRMTHPLVYHVWNRFSSEESDFYYRGFIYHSKRVGWSCHSDLYECMKDMFSNPNHLPPQEELIKIGKVISDTYKEDADSIVAASSIQTKCNGHTACVVYGATQPVMPLAEAAAKETDIGIVIRLFPNEGRSRLTFHTKNGTDLSFVHEGSEYFPGGGGTETRGCCIDGILMIDPQLSSLEECVYAMNQM